MVPMPTAAPVPPPLIGPAEAARILGVTVPRLAQLRREHRIQSVRYGREYLYDKGDVACFAAMLEAQRALKRKDI